MAKADRSHVSSDKTMQKWPINIDQSVDAITPYPCQTCKQPFKSCHRLATHKCNPVRRSTVKQLPIKPLPEYS